MVTKEKTVGGGHTHLRHRIMHTWQREWTKIIVMEKSIWEIFQAKDAVLEVAGN